MSTNSPQHTALGSVMALVESLAEGPRSEALAADRRFDDPAWQGHPAYRALGETYLAWAQQLHSAIDALGLPGRQPEQWHAAAGLLIDALAPTNTLIGNPAALRRAFDTGGASLAAGAVHALQDLLGNQGMPSTVDATGFEVGRNLAATPGQVVHRHEMFELIRYDTAGDAVHEQPFLYVPPQINRFYMIDLAPGRSFIEYAVQQGFQPFVMSWRNPGPEHRDWGLDAYVAAVHEAIEVACRLSGSESLNLAGSCTGGITATCAAALLRSRGSTRLNSLTLMVTMIDTSAPTAFNLNATPQSVALTKRLVAARGFVDGREMAGVFAWLRPNEMVWSQYVRNVLMGEKPPSFDMLAWNKDTTRLPARMHADLLDLGTQNFLALPGTRQVQGQSLDLRAIDVPTYIIGGQSDHIAPWASCYAATQAMRGEATFVLGNGGHIQSIIAPPGTRKAGYWLRDGQPPADAQQWLHGATLHEGSWWPHWRDWLAERSGPRRAERSGRTRTSSTRHRAEQAPSLGPAPGTYVFGR
jgi:polyhydroxyalkanoate synthase